MAYLLDTTSFFLFWKLHVGGPTLIGFLDIDGVHVKEVIILKIWESVYRCLLNPNKLNKTGLQHVSER